MTLNLIFLMLINIIILEELQEITTAKALLNSAHMPERYMKITVRQARVTEELQVITAAH